MWRIKEKFKKSDRDQRHAGQLSRPAVNLPHAVNSQPAPGQPSGDKTPELSTLPSADMLWTMAYDQLKESNPGLLKAYEKILLRTQEQTSNTGAEVAVSGAGAISGPAMRDRMKILFDSKVAELEKQKSAMDLYGQQLIDIVTKTVTYSKDILAPVFDASPYPSMAVAGISLLFLPAMNISEQRSARVDALFEIKFALDESLLRLEGYRGHLDSGKNEKLEDGTPQDLLQSYADALRALLQEILRFQVETICFLFSTGFERHLRDASKWNDWKGMLATVQTRIGVVRGFDGLFHSSLQRHELERQSRVQSDLRKQLEGIFEQLSSLRVDAQHENKRKELLEWLRTPNCTDDYNRLRENHQPLTNAWLFRDDTHMTKWKQADHSFMWIHGETGTGKSVLSSSIIEHLKSEHKRDAKVATCYFFITFREPEKQKSSVIARSVIRQLCDRNPAFLDALIDKDQLRDQDDTAALKLALRLGGTFFDAIYLDIDAIDECSISQERTAVFKLIEEVLKLKLDYLHVVLTSRWEMQLNNLCLTHDGSVIDLQNHSKELQNDIRIIVESENAFQKLDTHIKKQFLERAGIMFQYVALQREEMEQCYSYDDVKQVISNAPEGLEEAYARILANVGRKHERKAMAGLQWLALSLRPITVNELAEGLVIDSDAGSNFKLENKRLFDPMLARSVLRGLVAVDHSGCVEASENKTSRAEKNRLVDDSNAEQHRNCIIRLAHSSIRDFLLGGGVEPRFAIHEFAAKNFILDSCLAYIIHTSYRNLQEAHSFSDLHLLDYCCAYWPLHAQQVFLEASDGQSFKNTDKLLQEFFNKDSRAFSVYIRNEPSEQFFHSEGFAASPAHIFAHYNLIWPLQLLGPGPNTAIGIDDVYEGSAPLHIAISRGHLKLAMLLLELGADPNLQDEYGLTSLHLAVRFREWCSNQDYHALILKLVEQISKFPDLHTCNHSGISVLQEAVDSGQDDIINLLQSFTSIKKSKMPTSSFEKCAQAIGLDFTARDDRSRESWKIIHRTMSGVFWGAISLLDVKTYIATYKYAKSQVDLLSIPGANGVYSAAHNWIVELRVPRRGFIYRLIEDLIRKVVEELSCATKPEDPAQRILSKYAQRWKKFSNAARLHSNLLRMLDRHFVRRHRDEGYSDIHYVRSLHFLAWKEIYIEKVKEQLVGAFLDLVKQERAGQIIDISGLQILKDSLISVGSIEEKKEEEWLSTYETVLERPFIDDASNYYVAVSQQAISEMHVKDYIDMVCREATLSIVKILIKEQVEQRLNEESLRVQSYLHPSTRRALLNACTCALVDDHLSTLNDLCVELNAEDRDEVQRRIKDLMAETRQWNRRERMVSIMKDYIALNDRARTPDLQD